MAETTNSTDRSSAAQGVSIGDVADGIHDAAIAGRDVHQSTVGDTTHQHDEVVGRDKITIQHQQIIVLQPGAQLTYPHAGTSTPIIQSPNDRRNHPTTATPPAQIFISYKRNFQPDETLALHLCHALTQAGHRAFIDQRLTVGLEWAAEIHRQIEASDFMLVLLSAASLNSEMVVGEIEHAHKHFGHTGKARLIPVRVHYAGPLPYPISQILDKLHYATWNGSGDDDLLVRQLLDAFGALTALMAPPAPAVLSASSGATPRPYADPRFLETLHEPGGAIRANSPFYIGRAEDDLLRRELSKEHGTTTTIRAARQTGKSSLLINSVAHARQQGSKVVYIDLQPVEASDLVSLDAFLRYFATMLVRKLRLDTAAVDRAWSSGLGAPDKTTYLLEEYVLPAINTHIVLALDEVDRLLQTPFHDNFFGLLRFWHNSRALDELWDKLKIILVISTEPHLLIRDVAQSPFNVGQKLRLQDFDETQIRELNRAYRSPLDDAAVADLIDYLQGHPYLTHKAIYTLVTDQLSWPQLRALATADHSPFGDHLRRYVWLLHDQPHLCTALKQVIRLGECPDEASFYRLLQAGLIRGTTRTACVCRCRLYTEYLYNRL